MTVNIAVIAGNLTRDVETRTTASGTDDGAVRCPDCNGGAS